MMLDPLMLRAVILRAPQYERAVALLWNEWQRFVVRHPISPTTIEQSDVAFAVALLQTGLVTQAVLRDDPAAFIATNQQWLSAEAEQLVEKTVWPKQN